MKRTICLVVCALFVVVMMSGVAFSAEKNVAKQGQEMMITGSINNANQIVAKDGQIFDVADTQEGKELLSHVGMKVQVKGTVLENEGKKQISVSAYEIIKE
jgi:ribosomal protein L4